MRRLDPAGEVHAPAAYVFGNAVGRRTGFDTSAWEDAKLAAHGVTQERTPTKALTAECREALRVLDLHFHDLRREAGSRWLDHGVALHKIQRWLGHANIAQTSTYLMAHTSDDGDSMRQFEARLGRFQPIPTGDENGASEPPENGEIATEAGARNH